MKSNQNEIDLFKKEVITFDEREAFFVHHMLARYVEHSKDKITSFEKFKESQAADSNAKALLEIAELVANKAGKMKEFEDLKKELDTRIMQDYVKSRARVKAFISICKKIEEVFEIEEKVVE